MYLQVFLGLWHESEVAVKMLLAGSAEHVSSEAEAQQLLDLSSPLARKVEAVSACCWRHTKIVHVHAALRWDAAARATPLGGSKHGPWPLRCRRRACWRVYATLMWWHFTASAGRHHASLQVGAMPSCTATPAQHVCKVTRNPSPSPTVQSTARVGAWLSCWQTRGAAPAWQPCSHGAAG